ncbi:MAG TPA: response regulator [Terriglobales bacterium]|jgi:FixJ family two-component response regulator|nr:response regulator [Terriglobales bacterium]
MPRYSKSVLLVDDNPADRALFGRDLSRLGFEVIQTGSVDEAMAAIVGGRVGCLVTDQLMSVSGHELASLATGVRADLGIIFLSGASAPRLPIPEGTVFIQKDDRAGLRNAVLHCMKGWRIDASPE